MKDSDSEFEKRILLDVIEQMSDPGATGRKQTTLRAVTLEAGSIGLVIAFFLALNEITHPFISAFFAAMAGCAIGFGLFLRFAQRQWPITCKHIDLQSVRRRLNEIGN